MAEQKPENTPPRFRKTKTDKWAVMATVVDLEEALSKGGKIEVLKKSGDWSSFTVASLGKPFDVDGEQMCYGYGPDDDAETPTDGQPRQSAPSAVPPTAAPASDRSEPLPEYQGGAEDEWNEF